jgi:hypothetical protein
MFRNLCICSVIMIEQSSEASVSIDSKNVIIDSTSKIVMSFFLQTRILRRNVHMDYKVVKSEG